MGDSYNKSGYLNSDFKIFYLMDTNLKNFEFHYHDFFKVLIFVNGNVSYIVEGKQYELKPYDIILINAGEIHKPIIHDSTPYERIIIYVSSQFFVDYKNDNYDLFHCFHQVRKQHSNLIRIKNILSTDLYSAGLLLASSFNSREYASSLYQKIKFIEYLILLNRSVLSEDILFMNAISANPTVLSIMKFINSHITEDLSIDIIAKEMFLNRSYIMHLFKKETGYTIGTYITEKRLFIAKRFIREGMSVTEACYQSGFKNYSAFYHHFKNKYHTLPKK